MLGYNLPYFKKSFAPLIYFSLNAIYRSWVGWMEWVRNPEIMANFTIEELKEMSENLCKFAESFLEYVMKVTERIAPKKIKKLYIT
jgi:hypothetical protein